MKLNVITSVEAPEGATHYFGEGDDMAFYKCEQIGVVGDHWFVYMTNKEWVMVSHYHPNYIMPIPEKWKT